MIRLDAYLAHAGLATRKQAKKFIRGGKVTVDGVTVKSAGTLVKPEQRILLEGQAAVLPPAKLTILLHKPTGFACSRNPAEAPLWVDLVPNKWLRTDIQPVGRLDRDTSGLLVLTTDGQLIHSLTHPGRKVGKRYQLTFTGTLHGDAVAQVAEGMSLGKDEKPARPAALQVLSVPAGDTRGSATLVLLEGRYRQVRRMIHSLGGEVVTLHRDRIGKLELPGDLPAGESREITEVELALLAETHPEDAFSSS